MTALETLDRRIDERLFGAFGEPRDARLYRRMRFIRRFEETCSHCSKRGCSTERPMPASARRPTASGLIEHLRDGDHLFSNHRCHGHFLAWTGDAFGLLAEIMGKPAGLCAGIGGSQHICAPGFKSNGVQGGIVPAAAGIALAEQLRGSDGLSVVFLGDGTLGEGIVYETLNLDRPVAAAAAARARRQRLVPEHSEQHQPGRRHRGPIHRVRTAGRRSRNHRRARDRRGGRRCGLRMSHAARSRRARSSIPTASATTPRTTTTGPIEEVQLRWGFDPLVVHGIRLDPDELTAIDTEVDEALEDCVTRVRQL